MSDPHSSNPGRGVPPPPPSSSESAPGDWYSDPTPPAAPPGPPEVQPQSPQPQQPAQPQYVVVQQSPSTNGLAIASLVLGIIWIYWIGSILAVIFGHVALAQIKKSGQGGRGLAIAGLTLGWIGVGFLTLFILIAASASG